MGWFGSKGYDFMNVLISLKVLIGRVIVDLVLVCFVLGLMIREC